MNRWIFVLLCLLLCHPAAASQSRPYRLTERRMANEQTALRLINRAAGRTVWTKHVGDLDCLAWSADGRALALSVYTAGKTPFHLLVWQEGRPARLVNISPALGGGSIDGVLDIQWSPDKRRLLFRGWQSGGKDLNVGQLGCLDRKTGRISFVPAGVRQMQWVGPARARYRVEKIVAHGNRTSVIDDPRPRFWTLR